VGKTTVIKKVAQILADREVRGFYTEEIRAGRQRQGFKIVTLDGAEGLLAHVDFPGPPRVSRYGVDVAGFEALVLPCLRGEGASLVLIDEIGKMECFSAAFVERVRTLLESETPVLAAIARSGGGFIAEVKRREDVEIIEVTRANRNELPRRIVEKVAAASGLLKAQT